MFETKARMLLGGTKENNIFPSEGSLIYPPGKSMNFHKKETEKIELVARARPGVLLLCDNDIHHVSSRQLVINSQPQLSFNLTITYFPAVQTRTKSNC